MTAGKVFFCCCFETGSHSVAQAGPEHELILLPQPLMCLHAFAHLTCQILLSLSLSLFLRKVSPSSGCLIFLIKTLFSVMKLLLLGEVVPRVESGTFYIQLHPQIPSPF